MPHKCKLSFGDKENVAVLAYLGACLGGCFAVI